MTAGLHDQDQNDNHGLFLINFLSGLFIDLRDDVFFIALSHLNKKQAAAFTSMSCYFPANVQTSASN